MLMSQQELPSEETAICTATIHSEPSLHLDIYLVSSCLRRFHADGENKDYVLIKPRRWSSVCDTSVSQEEHLYLTTLMPMGGHLALM